MRPEGTSQARTAGCGLAEKVVCEESVAYVLGCRDTVRFSRMQLPCCAGATATSACCPSWPWMALHGTPSSFNPFAGSSFLELLHRNYSCSFSGISGCGQCRVKIFFLVLVYVLAWLKSAGWVVVW